MKVLLMVTCLGDVIRPSAAQATVTLLRRLGHTVEFRETQTCCGQPLMNSGFLDLAREQARYTIEVFAGDEPVVVPSGSCAAMVREYPHLLRDDPAWHARAEQLAQRTSELCDFLVHRLGVVDCGARYRGKLAFHLACHLRMLPGAAEAARTLLAHISGATCVPLSGEETCCGFGGSFAVRYPQISGKMVEDKVQAILASGADCVVSTDTGCLMNIAGRLHRAGHRVDVRHIAEILVQR